MSTSPPLTDEQLDAIARVEARLAESPEAVLVGPAGSGKTTLLRVLLDHLEASGREVVLAAPTGKAAARLAEATGREATTLHRRIYRGVDAGERDDELLFSEPKAATGAGAVLVVDEASMVGTQLYGDVMAHRAPGSAVLWVGDREQLEPVEDRWGPNLGEPTAELGTVHRHAAENPILAYATAVREGRGAAWRRDWPNGDDRLRLRAEPLEAAVAWAADAAGRDAITVTWTHDLRERINAGVRERLGRTEPLEAGDRVLVRANSGPVGVMNGELLTVDSVHPTEMFDEPVFVLRVSGHAREVRVFTRHLNDRGRGVWATRKRVGPRKWDRYRFLHLWHGHCLTVHSAQGSQWPEVAFVYGPALLRQARTDPDGVRRLVYTAVTRASERLVVFQLPD
ncbi:MAG: AAA family ATPase [Myxococcota bacterium]